MKATEDKIRVALIGPVAPFRGGVAQYTTSLHEALDHLPDVELTTISFKRQYPQWLYPGQTDKETDAQAIAGVEYTIDAYNPLTWRQAANRIAKQACQVAILDWWTLFWQPGFAYIARRLRKKGVKTVFLCHNLFDHDATGLKRKISQQLLLQADGYIVQSSEQQAMLQELKPGAEVVLKTHPIYDRFPPATEPLSKRGKLELLFFGFIRPYKGLPVLMEAMKQLNDHDIYLTVVGEPWSDAEALEQELQEYDVPNLELNLHYVDDAEAANYYARADAVVLPYRSATGSGVVSIAYHYDKPVVATSVGGLKDVVEPGKTGWLVEADKPAELAQTLGSVTREACSALRPGIESFCRQHSWQNMAETIKDLARS